MRVAYLSPNPEQPSLIPIAVEVPDDRPPSLEDLQAWLKTSGWAIAFNAPPWRRWACLTGSDWIETPMRETPDWPRCRETLLRNLAAVGIPWPGRRRWVGLAPDFGPGHEHAEHAARLWLERLAAGPEPEEGYPARGPFVIRNLP